MRGDQRRAGQWAAAAREIHAEVCDRAVDARGVFTQHYGAGTLDASVLLLPLVHFLPPGDERIRRTVLAVADELTVDGLVLRYRTGETDDGLTGEEGRLRSAPSGWSPRWQRSASSRGPGPCVSGCWPPPARCCCMPRRSIRAAPATSAISRRHSPTLP